MKSNVGRIASVVWTGVLWTALAWPAAAGAAAEAQASTYVDPQSRFTIAVPPGAELVDVGNGLEFSIRSRAGYAINVQTAEANLNMGLDEMVWRFENQHLGPSKAVSTKLSERFATIGGLSAYDAVYEGSRTRMRVVIARGAETDYAFLYLRAGSEIRRPGGRVRFRSRDVPALGARENRDGEPGPRAHGGGAD